MRLDPDCVRDILLYVESKNFNEPVLASTLAKSLPKYTGEQLAYTSLTLADGGYLIAELVYGGDIPSGVKLIHRLSSKGHDFLENIRKPAAWKKTKKRCEKIGSFALDVISNVASSLIAAGITGKI